MPDSQLRVFQTGRRGARNRLFEREVSRQYRAPARRGDHVGHAERPDRRRWSSDLYRLYVRACFEHCKQWSAKAGSARFTPTCVFDEVEEY